MVKSDCPKLARNSQSKSLIVIIPNLFDEADEQFLKVLINQKIPYDNTMEET